MSYRNRFSASFIPNSSTNYNILKSKFQDV